MAEISVLSAGRDYQEIIWNRPVADENMPSFHVKAGDLAEIDLRIALSVKDAAYRRCNIRGRKAGGCDLIQERLEKVVIAPINHDDLQRRVLERVCRRQSAEAGADD